MRGMIKSDKREKLEKILLRIRQRAYQANIALQSHDRERLSELAMKIRINGRLIQKELERKGKRKNGKAGRRKIGKIRNKKPPR